MSKGEGGREEVVVERERRQEEVNKGEEGREEVVEG